MNATSERTATKAMIPGPDRAYVTISTALSSGIGIAENGGVGGTGTDVEGTDTDMPLRSSRASPEDDVTALTAELIALVAASVVAAVAAEAGSGLLEIKVVVTASTTASAGVGTGTGTESGAENGCNEDEKCDVGGAEFMVAFVKAHVGIDASCGRIERHHQFHDTTAWAADAQDDDNDDSAGGTNTTYACPWNEEKRKDDDNGDDNGRGTLFVFAERR